MIRAARAGLVGVLLAGALQVAGMFLPGRAFACSCAQPDPEQIGRYAAEPKIAVFIGTVVSVHDNSPTGDTVGDIVIERVFSGLLSKSKMTVIGGGGGDCTIHISVGQRMITAASYDPGSVRPGLCMPRADPLTPEGRQLIAIAEAAYGPGYTPGQPNVTPGDRFGMDATEVAGALLALVLALGVAAAVFGVVIVLSRRRGRSTR